MTGYRSKKEMAQERQALFESPSLGVNDYVRIEQLEKAIEDSDDPTLYEHEVVTTVRITFRSHTPYIKKDQLLEEYAYLTDFSDLLDKFDGFPRVVATSVITDQIEYMDKEIQDE
jgi:hypothetical protein